MKSTKRTALNARIAKMKFASNSIVGSMITNFGMSERGVGHMFRPVYSQGSSWKHSTLVDKTMELKGVLDKLGIEYTEGNDAPKGGRTGKFIQVTTKIID